MAQAKAPRHNYGYLEWKTNSIFQLYRLTDETVYSGTWTRATKYVPVTGLGTSYRLDIADRDHSRLAERRDVASKEKAESFTVDNNVQSAVEMGLDETYSVHTKAQTYVWSLHIHFDGQSDSAESVHCGSRPMWSEPDLEETL